MLVALLHCSAATAAAATIVAAAAAVAATGSFRGEYCRASAGNIHASYICHIHASIIHIRVSIVRPLQATFMHHTYVTSMHPSFISG